MLFFQPSSLNATRITASAYGILVGFASMEHGIFEILQGNVRPGSILIDAIGPGHKIWEGASESAITVIPNFLITGILAMLMGLIIILWSCRFIKRKYGVLIFSLLVIIQLLVGGGIAPILIAILAIIAAIRIDKPHTWWKTHIPAVITKFLAIIWPLCFIAFILLFFIVVEIGIFGWFFGVSDPSNILATLPYYMMIPMVLAVPAAIGYDIQKKTE